MNGEEKLINAIRQAINQRACWIAGNNEEQIQLLFEELADTTNYIAISAVAVALSGVLGTLGALVSSPPDRTIRASGGKILLGTGGGLLIGLAIAIILTLVKKFKR